MACATERLSNGDKPNAIGWWGWARGLISVVKGGAWARLSPSARSVLLVLAAHADVETAKAFPSLATIGRLAGLRRSATIRALNELDANSLTRRGRRGGGAHARTTLYQLTLPVHADGPVHTDGPVREDGLHPSSVVYGTRPSACTQTGSIEQGPRNNGVRRTSDDPLLRRFTDRFCELWRQRNGENGQEYPFAGAKDTKAAKRILAAVGGDPNAAEPVFARYFDEKSDFYRGHPLAKLSCDLARFIAKPAGAQRRTGRRGGLPLT